MICSRCEEQGELCDGHQWLERNRRVLEAWGLNASTFSTIVSVEGWADVLKVTTKTLPPTPWAYTTNAEVGLRRVLELLPSVRPLVNGRWITTDALREIRGIIKQLGNL